MLKGLGSSASAACRSSSSALSSNRTKHPTPKCSCCWGGDGYSFRGVKGLGVGVLTMLKYSYHVKMSLGRLSAVIPKLGIKRKQANDKDCESSR